MKIKQVRNIVKIKAALTPTADETLEAVKTIQTSNKQSEHHWVRPE